MELHKALSQISEIHAQVLRSEVFRGYRSVPVAVTSVLALLAASLQDALLAPADARAFVVYWVAVAGLCAAICVADLIAVSVTRGARALRRDTARVVAQLVPAVLVGGVVTLVLARLEHPAPALLPGLWALVYCTGIFSSRPYLPRAIGWVAAYYFVAGAYLLATAGARPVPSPWSVGLTFGLGQAGAALVLYLNLERNGDGG